MQSDVVSIQTPVAARTNWNEAERLAALLRYGILDTPPEPDFDHITRVASLVCKAPISVVNLISDTRQWFKSEIGLGIRETPIDVSICAKAILQPDVLVVPNLARNPVFDCNPLVVGEPHLRFYAGARLDTPEGLPLGTVCVLDYKPRPQGLTEEQTEVLRALARQAMVQIELRRALRAHELLAQELSHRIKNIFTVVAGLATASARGNEAARGFAAAFRSRLGALSQAHDYVLSARGAARSGHPKRVQKLLQMLLAPYDEERRTRFSITGDDTELGVTAAASLALVIHELSTNSAKYGALSTAGGRIDVRGECAGDSFILHWDEQGGPKIAGPPHQQGFGSVMTMQAMGHLGGSIIYDWARDGLRVRLTAARSELAR